VQNIGFAVRVPLNGVCIPRAIAPDVACVTNIECKVCVGSAAAGLACANNAQCRGCLGGSNPGTPCTSNVQCLGGGTCEAPGAGTCTGAGTCRNAKLEIEVGSPDVNNETPLTIPQSSVVLNPAVVSGVGTVCVSSGGDGEGVIDCDGGRANLDFTLERDHNTTPGDPGNSGSGMGLADDAGCDDTFVQPDLSIGRACIEGTSSCDGGMNDGMPCTMPGDCPMGTCSACNNSAPHPGVCNSPTQATVAGTFVAGDIAVALPLAITVLDTAANFGPDGLPCTADDTPADPPAAVPVSLSTGTNTIRIFDSGSIAGATIGPGQTCGANPCVAQIVGQGLSCANLNAGMLTGTKFGGGFPAFDTAAGDIATVFQFEAQ
jgi:hypothetical protein